MDQDVGLSVFMCNSEHPDSIYMGAEPDDWELSGIKTAAQEDKTLHKEKGYITSSDLLIRTLHPWSIGLL